MLVHYQKYLYMYIMSFLIIHEKDVFIRDHIKLIFLKKEFSSYMGVSNCWQSMDRVESEKELKQQQHLHTDQFFSLTSAFIFFVFIIEFST